MSGNWTLEEFFAATGYWAWHLSSISFNKEKKNRALCVCVAFQDKSHRLLHWNCLRFFHWTKPVGVVVWAGCWTDRRWQFCGLSSLSRWKVSLCVVGSWADDLWVPSNPNPSMTEQSRESHRRQKSTQKVSHQSLCCKGCTGGAVYWSTVVNTHEESSSCTVRIALFSCTFSVVPHCTWFLLQE